MRFYRFVADMGMFALPTIGSRTFMFCVLACYAGIHFVWPGAVRLTRTLDKLAWAGNFNLW
jgi:hypothetical protein